MSEVVEEIGQAWGRPTPTIPASQFREAIPLREVTNAQLGVQMLESANIASILADAFKFDEDLKRSLTALTTTNKYLSTNMLISAQKTSSIVGKTARDMLKQALIELPQSLTFFNQRIRNQAIQSSAGYRLTATILGQENKLFGVFNNIDLFSRILFDIPETFAEKQVRRFYNAEFALERVNERDSWILFRNGLVKTEYLLDSYRLEHGLPLLDAQNLMKIRDWQVGKASLRDAYYMVKKGFKKEEYFHNIATLGQGWSKADSEMLFKYYDRDPSLRELMTLNDLMPLEPKWLKDKLDAIGLSAYDRSVYESAMEKRVIRDEITKVWGLLLDNYAWGIHSQLDLTTFLTNFKFSKPEIDIRIQIGELSKMKLRIKLLRDAEIYLYRKDQTNENQCLSRLTAIGISRDIGNAIVRNEAAKRGVDWEMEEDDLRRLYLSVNNSEFGDTNPTVGSYYYPVGKKVAINGNPIGEHYVGYWLLDGEVYGIGETLITVEMKIAHTVQCMFDAEPPE